MLYDDEKDKIHFADNHAWHDIGGGKCPGLL